MSGVYGWNIEDVENYESESDTENIKMPMPEYEETVSGPRLDFSHPQIKGAIKGCWCCCCVESEDDVPQNPGGNQGRIDMDPRGFFWCEYNGSVPDNAVKAGVDKDGGTIYIGRAIHEGEMQPAKVVPNHGCAYVAYDGSEVSKSDFEVLCRGSCMVIWQECSDGSVPPEAVSAGVTSDGERLYVGRVFHDGVHVPGKIHPTHGCCYVPYGGEELSFNVYEVLIMQ